MLKLNPKFTTSCTSKDCRPLITGCGRSGTHFIAEEIMANNIDVKHERIGSKGSVSWIYGVPHVASERTLETWFASEQDTLLRELPTSEFQFFPIVHVVRHPIKAIASLLTCFCGCGSMQCGGWADEPSWEWAGKHIAFSQKHCTVYRIDKNGQDRTPPLCISYGANERVGRLIRSMEYWVHWNEIIEPQAHYRAKMETYDLKELADTVGWELQGEVKQQGEPFQSIVRILSFLRKLTT